MCALVTVSGAGKQSCCIQGKGIHTSFASQLCLLSRYCRKWRASGKLLLPVCNTLTSVSVASVKNPSVKELINLHYGTSKLTIAISKVIYFCPLRFLKPTGEKGLLSLNCQNNQSYHKLSAPYTMFQLSLGEKKKSHQNPLKTLLCHANTWRAQALNYLEASKVCLPGIAVNLLWSGYIYVVELWYIQAGGRVFTVTVRLMHFIWYYSITATTFKPCKEVLTVVVIKWYLQVSLYKKMK